MSKMKTGRGVVTAVWAVLALVPMGAAHAAEFGIEPGSFAADSFQADGVTSETQAGAHPFAATTTFRISSNGTPPLIAGHPQNLRVKLPHGFVGNPEAAPKCTRADFAGMVAETGATCPAESQVGVNTIEIAYSAVSGGTRTETRPVYNVEPLPGQTADFATPAGGNVPVHIIATVDDADDYAIRADVTRLTEALPVLSSKVTLWGVPGDPRHLSERACGTKNIPGGICAFFGDWAQKPFLTNPTECGGSLTATLNTDSWENPGDWKSASYTPAKPIDGCDRLLFEPTIDVGTTTHAPDAPTGFSVDLTFPQSDDPNGLGRPPLRTAKVTLPDGMTINPASAGGLAACSDAQLGLKTDSPIGCPDGAKIGTVIADTPLLAQPLTGSVYLRTQNSDDPASGEMFRMALVLESKERGLLIKLPGSVKVDPGTGRIVTEFVDNPQLPVRKISLDLKSGPRAPLASPATCGEKTVDAQLTSWGGQSVDLQSKFTVDCTSGLGGFTPGFSAGAVQPVGGALSPFTVGITKPDGNSPLTGLTMQLPPGLVANLKGNIGTQVGTVKTYAGPGTNPYMLPGKVFLEGPYGDAPFSLRVVVPAIAGPFNLGEVVVRQKIYVDPTDAHVTVVSDPLPTIVKGVPVRLQRLDVDVDKPGFMINPTSCAPMEIKGTLSSVAGQTVPVTTRFQVGECASLGYAPKLAMTMTGKGQTKDGSHPALTARLTPPAGDANNKKVTVTLPLALALDPGNANGLCEPADAARNACAASTIVGSAQAQSILPEALKAPVYFVRGERLDSKGKVRKTLPKLFIPLTANGVTVNVTGSSDVEDDRLVTTFDNLPDAPFSTFELNINGGQHGILAVSGTNVCAASNVADAEYAGQNGKTYTSKVTMGTPCALGIVKSSHTSTALKITIGGLGSGKVSGSGNGVAKASKTLASATTATLTLKLAKATRRALARGRDVKVKVKVAFTAKGQKKAKTASKTLAIHGAKKR